MVATIEVMPAPPLTRVTVALLELLLEAFEQNRDLDGFELMKAMHRSAPAVYAVLDRLESAGWIEGEFEQGTDHGQPQPRQCFYRLTGIGVEAARAHSAKRRRHASRSASQVGVAHDAAW
jgi:PadR family transcriptional regulator, regulatory protein PadR